VEGITSGLEVRGQTRREDGQKMTGENWIGTCPARHGPPATAPGERRPGEKRFTP
jgi:hypothetical protein